MKKLNDIYKNMLNERKIRHQVCEEIRDLAEQYYEIVPSIDDLILTGSDFLCILNQVKDKLGE